MNLNDNWKRRAFYFVATAFVIACGTDRGMMSMVGDAMMDAGSVLRDASRSDAAAQPATGCSQWEFSRWDALNSCASDIRPEVGCAAPAGWEPFGGDSTNSVYLRRCTSP